MSGADSPGDLLAALAAERAALAALVAVLEREQVLLVGADADAIGRIAEEKDLAVRRAEAAGAARARRAARPDPAQGEAVGAAWRALLEEARRARALNDANGRLIALQAGFARARLASLAGAAEGYGPQGAAAVSAPARTLGAA
ncbi:MAG: flagellar export chaperone FlgN [Burkholderiales bacterium]|nr:flagellar export chaperone FlgN [Burkholderiales bacterium]